MIVDTEAVNPWSAPGVCFAAAHLTGGDREKTHGDKRQNFANIARAWNAILEAKGIPGILDAHDAANMLETMKIMRRYTGVVNLDDYVDGAGYAGVAAEVVQHE